MLVAAGLGPAPAQVSNPPRHAILVKLTHYRLADFSWGKTVVVRPATRSKSSKPQWKGQTGCYTSLHISPRGERKCVGGASIRGARRSARGGVLESTLSTTSERNEVVAHLSRAFAVRWRDMQARAVPVCPGLVRSGWAVPPVPDGSRETDGKEDTRCEDQSPVAGRFGAQC